ncbi:hypothetical protein Tco_1037089 [Tanacetum coccineum]
MLKDTPEPAQEGAVEVTYETLRDLVQRFHDHTEAIPVHRIQRVAELERDNRRLRGTMRSNKKKYEEMEMEETKIEEMEMEETEMEEMEIEEMEMV